MKQRATLISIFNDYKEFLTYKHKGDNEMDFGMKITDDVNFKKKVSNFVDSVFDSVARFSRHLNKDFFTVEVVSESCRLIGISELDLTKVLDKIGNTLEAKSQPTSKTGKVDVTVPKAEPKKVIATKSKPKYTRSFTQKAGYVTEFTFYITHGGKSGNKILPRHLGKQLEAQKKAYKAKIGAYLTEPLLDVLHGMPTGQYFDVRDVIGYESYPSERMGYWKGGINALLRNLPGVSETYGTPIVFKITDSAKLRYALDSGFLKDRSLFQFNQDKEGLKDRHKKQYKLMRQHAKAAKKAVTRNEV